MTATLRTQAPRPTAARPIARRGPGRTARIGPGRERRRNGGFHFTPLRAGALLAMLLALVAGLGLTVSPAFAYRTLEVAGSGELITARTAIDATVASVAGTGNVFLADTRQIERALEELPAVAGATVAVGLPGTLRVVVSERNAVIGWVVGTDRFVVDETGLVVARFPTAEPGPSDRLVTVIDRRAAATSIALGSSLDPVLIDAATRLGSLTTGDVGSERTRYRLALDDLDGFTFQPLPAGPVAVFGIYTASLRPPAMIPGQVRLLRSLLVGREGKLGRIILASATNGTYLPKGVLPPRLPTPVPSAAPAASPSATPAP